MLSVSTIGRKLKRNFGYGTQCYKRSLEQKMKDRHRKVSKRAKNQPITIISFKNYILQYFPKKTKARHTQTYHADYQQKVNFIFLKMLTLCISCLTRWNSRIFHLLLPPLHEKDGGYGT